MAAGGQFGCQKLTFDGISGHFRSIRNKFFYWTFLQNGRRRRRPKFTFDPISNHFRSIRNFLLLNFYKMASGAHIVCPIISGHFGSIRNFNVFGHFWCLPSAILDVRNSLSIAFLAISDRYTTFYFLFFLTKWLPLAMSEIHFLSHFWPF